MQSKKDWSAVLRAFGTPRHPRDAGDGEWLWAAADELHHVGLRLPRKSSLVIVTPKSHWLDWWEADGSLSGVTVVASSRPAEPRGLAVLELVAGRAPALFVGDLDPHHLVQFVETRRLMATRGLAIAFGGLSDAWWPAMERGIRGGFTLERLRIRLDRSERTLLARIERALDLDDLVGPRAAALLRSGYKIEIEAATNPALYARGHGRRVVRLLRAHAGTPSMRRRRRRSAR
jgi:hypothetical protein